LIDSRVVVELKSTEKNDPVAFKQVLSYLKVMNLPIGLVIKFGMSALKDGITRVINTLNTGSLRLCASVRR